MKFSPAIKVFSRINIISTAGLSFYFVAALKSEKAKKPFSTSTEVLYHSRLSAWWTSSPTAKFMAVELLLK